MLPAALGSPDPHRDAAAVLTGLAILNLLQGVREPVSLEPLHGHAILGGCFGQRALS